MIDLLHSTWIEFLKIIPILVGAIFVAQIVGHFLAKKEMHKKIGSSNKNIARAAGIGLVTPGPLLAYLPTLKDMQKKGVPLSLIIAFITGQTLIGPLRIFLEINYFGVLFFLIRAVISFLLAIAIGISFRVLQERFKIIKKI
ncbi:permease [Patescibacteria group bacterium]|nr:permease [Patescibacteria group bacterium]